MASSAVAWFDSVLLEYWVLDHDHDHVSLLLELDCSYLLFGSSFLIVYA